MPWQNEMADLDDLKHRVHQELAHQNAVVFAATLDQLQNFQPVLTACEQARFDRVRLPDQRRLHGLGRGLVRYFLDLPRDDFTLGDDGKPRCSESTGAAGFFNISHTGRMISVALHRHSDLGIDIETPTRGLRDETLVARVCHPKEAKWIARHSQQNRPQAFLRCWVRKEAVLKAQGTGLVDDLQGINTHLQDRFPVLHAHGGLRLWDFPAGFSAAPGALATRSDVARVSYLSPAGIMQQTWPSGPLEPVEVCTPEEVIDDSYV